MTIKKQTHIILSFESDRKNEIQHASKRWANSIDAVYLKNPVLLQASATVHIIGELKDFMRKNNFDKPIIIDYKFDYPMVESELDYLRRISSLFKNEGAYGMTVMAFYGEDFIKACKKESEIGIFAIVDVDTPSFKENVNDVSVVKNAIFVRDNECEGVIMTSRHLDRIKKVREAVGKDFRLLSTLKRGDKLGDTISAGADFEIVPYQVFRKSL